MAYDVAPNEWMCQVIVAITESGGADRAAETLQQARPGYRRQSVEKVMRNVEEWAGGSVWTRGPDKRLRVTERGQAVVDSARHVLKHYQLMRQGSGRSQLPTLACLPHHTHFVSLAEDSLWKEPPAETDKLVVEYLPQGDASESVSYQVAATHLETGSYQLIIGPKLDHRRYPVESTPLYRAQLEAMVGVAYPEDAIPLPELIAGHRLLVPPRNMRARQVLEDAIVDFGIRDPAPTSRIAAETNEVATSVMRIRNEQSRRGADDSRLVVAPSDVALAFKKGWEFGGLNADRFKWVPIYHRDESGRDHLLTMDVCVTTRRGRGAGLRAIVSALQQAVDHINRPGGVGLEGETARLRGRIPAQGAAWRERRIDPA